MNNSIENGLIVAVLFIIIFVPIYLSIRSARNKKTKKIKSEVRLLEKNHNLSFGIIEQLDSFSIVIDEIKKVIAIVNLNDCQSELIDLKQVSDCRLEERLNGRSVQLIQLVLSDKKGQTLHQIVFYRQYTDNEGNLKRTARIAEQWQVIIKAAIADRKPFLILERAN